MKAITILGIEYKIVLTDREDVHGEVDFNKCEILLHRGMVEGMQLSSLLHEIVEVINFRLELKLSHPKITSLETAFFQVLRENPALLERLLDSSEKKHLTSKKKEKIDA